MGIIESNYMNWWIRFLFSFVVFYLFCQIAIRSLVIYFSDIPSCLLCKE